VVVQNPLSQSARSKVESGLLEDGFDPWFEIVFFSVRVPSEIPIHG
jgi:hypothetical protein